MKKQNFLYFLTAMGVLACMNGCLGKDESYSSYTLSSPAVVCNEYEADATATAKYLGSSYGYIVPSNASLLDTYDVGDCVWTNCTVDSRDQIYGANYYVGSGVQVEIIGQTKVANTPTPKDTVGCSFPTSLTSFFNQSFDPFYYDGKIFVRATVNISTKQEVDYELSCDFTHPDEDGVYDLYMKGKIDGGDAKGAANTDIYYAFDLNELFKKAEVRDVTYSSYDFRAHVLKIRLNYLSDDGSFKIAKPTYSTAAVQELYLYVSSN